MCSKKYDTMAEAKEAEINFLIYAEKMKSIPVKMTFQELFDAFCKHKSTSVKDSTYIGYTKHIKYFKMFMKVKCVDYNIHQFENWRKMMLKKKLSLRYKNDLIKNKNFEYE